MFPVRDVIPSRTFPWVTIVLLDALFLVFAWQCTLGAQEVDRMFRTWGVQPALFSWSHLPSFPFVHAGWAHVVVNALYLWLFGPSVEDRLGPARFATLLFVGAGLGAAVYVARDPFSLLPLVGATTAITGLLGAYVSLFPRSQILAVVPALAVVEIPSLFFIGLWFALQLAIALPVALGMHLVSTGAGLFTQVVPLLGAAMAARALKRSERMRVEWWNEVSKEEPSNP